ncbi:MAG: hypothetical protein IKF11_02535 [Methanobrevibacter sp.]|nr:hypothetical protein [Methanobrevibacter sp.]
MAKKEIDFEKEVDRVSRKSNIDIMRLEYSLNRKVRNLDKEINKLTKQKIKEFDNAKKSTKEFVDEEESVPTIEEYKKILDEY